MRKLGQKAMWFRASEFPMSKPKFFQYVAKNGPQKCSKFSNTDSDALEAAWRSSKQTQRVLDDGLFTVDLEKSIMRPTYWDGPHYKVIRGTWFKQSSMQPVPESLAQRLEKLWSKLSANHEGESDAQFEEQKVLFKIRNGVVTATMDESSILDTIRSLGAAKQVYVRGYHPPTPIIDNVKSALPKVEVPTEEQPQKRDIDHLVFCIHGVGQKLGLRFDFVSFVKDTGTFRAALQRAYENSPEAQEAVGKGSDNKVQVLPVLWRQDWELSAEQLNPKLKNVNASTVFYRDNVLADVVLDFLAYQDAVVREQIEKITVDLIKKQYKQFCDDHPGFAANPKVSIVGHSLGSVIANNILRRKDNPFDFEPENLFLMGSPVGILDLITGTSFEKEGLHAKNVYNILRPSDPVASRLEPMVSGEVVRQVVPMPLSRKDDSLINHIVDSINSAVVYTNKLASNVNSVWQSMTSALINDKTNVDDVELKPVPTANLEKIRADLAPFNRYSRLDFSIPENIEISLAIGLAGHLTYLESPEVAAFVLKELYKLGDPSKIAVVMERSE